MSTVYNRDFDKNKKKVLRHIHSNLNLKMIKKDEHMEA